MTEQVAQISEQAQDRLQQLQYLGTLKPGDIGSWTLLNSSHGQSGQPEHVELFLAIDEDQKIRQVRFKSPATGNFLLVYEFLCHLALGVSLKQAAHITPLQVRRKVQDALDQDVGELPWPDHDPFPIMQKICNYRAPSVESVGEDQTEKWDDLGLFEKVRRIEEVLDDNVRPMLASDGGGIELVDLREDELVVHYQGACGSCSASIGGTLVFIQETLNDALDADLTVKPEGLDESAFIM